MQELIRKVKLEVMNEIELHKKTSENHYDFWAEHIKYVYEESIKLANKYGANTEIVELGALLHDIALIKRIGTRAEHHINGAKIGKEILEKHNCPEDIKEKVLGCILNHRNLDSTTNIEERCVCDADCLSHFKNITMLYSVAFKQENITLDEVRSFMKKRLEKDYYDLSENTRKEFEDQYKNIVNVVLGE